MKNKRLVIIAILALIIAITLGVKAFLVKKETETYPPARSFQGTERGPFVSIAKKLPAFGGFFIEGNAVFVYLLDSSQLPEAEKTIKEEFNGDPRISQLEFKALKADYSFLQLMDWKEKINQGIEYNSLDLDESKNKIIIGVVNLDASKEKEIKQRLNNLTVPLSAVIIVKTEPIRF